MVIEIHVVTEDVQLDVDRLKENIRSLFVDEGLRELKSEDVISVLVSTWYEKE